MVNIGTIKSKGGKGQEKTQNGGNGSFMVVPEEQIPSEILFQKPHSPHLPGFKNEIMLKLPIQAILNNEIPSETIVIELEGTKNFFFFDFFWQICCIN